MLSTPYKVANGALAAPPFHPFKWECPASMPLMSKSHHMHPYCIDGGGRLVPAAEGIS